MDNPSPPQIDPTALDHAAKEMQEAINLEAGYRDAAGVAVLEYQKKVSPTLDKTLANLSPGTGFAIVCLQCGNTHVQQWDRSRGGEYEGKLFKCGDCGQE